MTTICHSNLFAHRMLTDQGACVHSHFSEDFEDIGDAESGPSLIGGPAFDTYQSESHEFIIDHTGLLVACMPTDWDQERWIAEMTDHQKNGAGQLDEEQYIRPRRAGEDFQITYRDEDGDWWACHGYGWTDSAKEAGYFNEAQAEQIAHRFNSNLPNLCGQARIVCRAPEPPIFKPTTSYTIDLHETQRLTIIFALRFMRERDPNYAALANEPGKYFNSAKEDFDILLEMFEELPETEAKHPGVVHGFAA